MCVCVRARACVCVHACLRVVRACACACVYGGFRDAQAKVELQERLQALREKGSAQVAAEWGGRGVGSGRVGSGCGLWGEGVGDSANELFYGFRTLRIL